MKLKLGSSEDSPEKNGQSYVHSTQNSKHRANYSKRWSKLGLNVWNVTPSSSLLLWKIHNHCCIWAITPLSGTLHAFIPTYKSLLFISLHTCNYSKNIVYNYRFFFCKDGISPAKHPDTNNFKKTLVIQSKIWLLCKLI